MKNHPVSSALSRRQFLGNSGRIASASALAGIAFASARPMILLKLALIYQSLDDEVENNKGRGEHTSRAAACSLIEARILNRQLTRAFLTLEHKDKNGDIKVMTSSVKAFPDTDIAHQSKGSKRLAEHIVRHAPSEQWRHGLAFGDWVELCVPCGRETRRLKKTSKNKDEKKKGDNAPKWIEETREGTRYRWVPAQVVHQLLLNNK